MPLSSSIRERHSGRKQLRHIGKLGAIKGKRSRA
ncbi:heat shock protein [Moniliophthora roreri]|nr:heat shock protein [Moniliophthora roreri]